MTYDGIGCPDPETLERFAEGRLPNQEQAVVAEHCDLCEECQVMTDFLKIAHRAEVTFNGGVNVQR